jgi:hypothetical protein
LKRKFREPSNFTTYGPKTPKQTSVSATPLWKNTGDGRWKFHANPSLEDALSGSGFVLVSILPGDFEEMAVDVHAPEKYGIYQSVGDTVGAGGLIRAMRTIPQFREIARAIKNRAPLTNNAFAPCYLLFPAHRRQATVAGESGGGQGGKPQRTHARKE